MISNKFCIGNLVIPCVVISIFTNLLCIMILSKKLRMKNICSSFERLKSAALTVLEFKSLFLDKGLELYDWQSALMVNSLDYLSPALTTLKIENLKLDENQINKINEIIESHHKKFVKHCNILIILIVASSIMSLFGISAFVELDSKNERDDFRKESIFPIFSLMSFVSCCCCRGDSKKTT